jgi:hypothetical protein
MRFISLVAFLLLGCGGGSSSVSVTPLGEQTQSLNAGLVRSDVPSTMKLAFTRPFYPAATVVLASEPTGPFEPAAGALPMELAGGEEPVLWVTFTPPAQPAPALQEGTIRVIFRPLSGGTEVPVTLNLRAQVETPSVRIVQEQISLGKVAVGETVEFSAYIENSSVATPVTVTDVTLPAGDFSIAPGTVPTPYPIAPGGGRFPVRLRFTPTALNLSTAVLRITHSASTVPAEVTLTGTGMEPRIELEDTVLLDPWTLESDWISFDVGPDATGILLEVTGDPVYSVLDLIGFEGPNNTVYERDDLSGPLDWLLGYPAGGQGFLTVAIPDSKDPKVQLVPGGGTYRFRLRDLAGATTTLQVRVTISQRHMAMAKEGTLDLRIFLADALPIADRANPLGNAKLSDALTTMDAILGANSIRVGQMTFVFMDPAWNVLASPADAENMFAANTAGLPEGPLNLFFVQNMTYGDEGFAGASPGPLTNGTPYSGVVVDFGAPYAATLGATAAHEIAHYLGQDGGTILASPDEAYPALRHPILDPGLPETLLSPPETTSYAQISGMINLMGPPGTWCGTCVHPSVR